MTDEQIAVLMGMLASAYPNREVSRPTTRVYAMMLQDLDYPVAEAAIQKLIFTSQYFPSIAEIRGAVAEIVNPGWRSAEEAWAEVKEAMRSGYYAPKNWSSPEVKEAVRAIGWAVICESEIEGVSRAHFFKVYGEIMDREKKAAVLPTGLRDTIKALGSGMSAGRLRA